MADPFQAEGRWLVWTDDQGVTRIARIDVPGNEGVEADFRSGRGRKPTSEELDRSIAWTADHPEWTQQVTREVEEMGGHLGDDPYGERADAEAALRTGPRLYYDSRTGNITQADRAPDPTSWWRLVQTADEAWASLATGEPAAVVPSDFTLLDPSSQIPVINRSITDLYGPAGPFRLEMNKLQREWGITDTPPEEPEADTWPPNTPPRQESKLLESTRIAQGEPAPPPTPPRPPFNPDAPRTPLPPFTEPSAWTLNLPGSITGLRSPATIASLKPEEQAPAQDLQTDTRISPFNQGPWPTEEELDARQEQVQKQLQRMKRENPALYEKLPLLHDILAPVPEGP